MWWAAVCEVYMNDFKADYMLHLLEENRFINTQVLLTLSRIRDDLKKDDKDTTYEAAEKHIKESMDRLNTAYDAMENLSYLKRQPL